jgi:hypothetical protein
VFTHQVVAAFKLSVGLQLFAVVGLLGDGLDELGARSSYPDAIAREISLDLPSGRFILDFRMDGTIYRAEEGVDPLNTASIAA